MPWLDQRLETGGEDVAGDAEPALEVFEAADAQEGVAQDEERPPLPHDLEGTGHRTVHPGEARATHMFILVRCMKQWSRYTKLHDTTRYCGGPARLSIRGAGAGSPARVLGIEFDSVESGDVRSRLLVERRHMAPNGFLHAASVIALADTSCGYGSQVSLPAGASGFTTVELKSNFMGTATAGDVIHCRAWLVHGGRSTQVWDAEVTDDAGKALALFRCTQMVLYPKKAS